MKLHFFCCGFLDAACGFPPEHISASLDLGTGSVVFAWPCPGSSLALGVGIVTIYLCPCPHVSNYTNSPCTNTQVKHGYNALIGIRQSFVFFVLNPSADIKITSEDPITDYFSVFRSWQLRMNAG